jgi:hypothetical protein
MNMKLTENVTGVIAIFAASAGRKLCIVRASIPHEAEGIARSWYEMYRRNIRQMNWLSR